MGKLSRVEITAHFSDRAVCPYDCVARPAVCDALRARLSGSTQVRPGTPVGCPEALGSFRSPLPSRQTDTATLPLVPVEHTCWRLSAAHPVAWPYCAAFGRARSRGARSHTFQPGRSTARASEHAVDQQSKEDPARGLTPAAYSARANKRLPSVQCQGTDRTPSPQAPLPNQAVLTRLEGKSLGPGSTRARHPTASYAAASIEQPHVDTHGMRSNPDLPAERDYFALAV